MDVDGMMIILDEIDEYIHVSDDINRIIMTINDYYWSSGLMKIG